MVYLPEPVTGKASKDGGDLAAGGLSYGVTEMQGWRRNMEDAALAVSELDEKVSLYGVFDGHGGRGVSRFAAERLPGLLKETEAFKQGDYARALERAFLAVDEQLREPSGRMQIEELDQPDPDAPVRPVAVPKKVLQRFLGRSDGEGADEEEEEEEELVPADVLEVAENEGEAAQAVTPGDAAAAVGAEEKGEEGKAEPAAVPASEAKGPEVTPEAASEKEGAATAPEKDGAAAAPEKEGTAAAPEKEGAAAAPEKEADGEKGDEDADDMEEIDTDDLDQMGDDDMALVDPSRFTRDPTPEAQGCTAVVVLVVRRPDGGGPRVFCANAGDSRAIMSRVGNVVALSEDHKPENPEETARIKKAGGFVEEMQGGARVMGDLNLSRAMGDLRYKKPENLPPAEQILTVFPEVRTFDLTQDDEFMVLGCDGIWERSTNQEMVDFVRPKLSADAPAKPLSEICGDICDKGLCPSMDPSENENFDGTGCDNMTVMIVQLKKQVGGEAKKRPAEGPAEGDGGEGKRQKEENVA